MKGYGIKEIYSTDRGFDRAPVVMQVFEELKGEPGYRDLR